MNAVCAGFVFGERAFNQRGQSVDEERPAVHRWNAAVVEDTGLLSNVFIQDIHFVESLAVL
jgi:hypothetical protein